MSSKQRINQGGSVITFVVIGVILAAGLIGAVYFLRQRGEQVRKDQAIAIYDREQADKKAAEAEAAKKEVASNNSNSEKTSGDSSEDSTQSEVNVTSELPATGIELSINQLIGTFALTTALTGFIVSRRSLARSL